MRSILRSKWKQKEAFLFLFYIYKSLKHPENVENSSRNNEIFCVGTITAYMLYEYAYWNWFQFKIWLRNFSVGFSTAKKQLRKFHVYQTHTICRFICPRTAVVPHRVQFQPAKRFRVARIWWPFILPVMMDNASVDSILNWPLPIHNTWQTGSPGYFAFHMIDKMVVFNISSKHVLYILEIVATLISWQILAI